MATHIPPQLIETSNTLVRTSRQMFLESGREPSDQQLAERLAMPLEKVRKIQRILRNPIRLRDEPADR